MHVSPLPVFPLPVTFFSISTPCWQFCCIGTVHLTNGIDPNYPHVSTCSIKVAITSFSLPPRKKMREFLAFLSAKAREPGFSLCIIFWVISLGNGFSIVRWSFPWYPGGFIFIPLHNNVMNNSIWMIKHFRFTLSQHGTLMRKQKRTPNFPQSKSRN